MASDAELLDAIRERAKSAIDGIKSVFNLSGSGKGNPWPQTYFSPISDGVLNLYPNYKTRGFLPPVKIGPNPDENTKKYGSYSYKDWRGHILNINYANSGSTKDKFEERTDIPDSRSSLSDRGYSTRDHYIIFGDRSTDYFKHGLQIMDNLGTLDGVEIPNSDFRLNNFKSTPFENNDPVIFGFDIVFDNLSSPLLNGSINDFLNNYSNVSEIASRVDVYNDFLNQFSKFFKTKTDFNTETPTDSVSKMRLNGSYATVDNNSNVSGFGKKSYMNYYLQGISGLSKLVENNTSDAKKYLVDYNKEIITLNFLEDVSLSVGTLAHLYKLLYWSKPNGKNIIPENLLRFNCDIIVSEMRNYKRVIRGLETNNLEVIKDNVSRYVYSLKECQLYFNNMPHEDNINMGDTPKVFSNYNVSFDYKYSTSRFERFVPKNSRGEGRYVSYDGGSLWKIGNPGERDNRNNSLPGDSSVPRFKGVGTNTLNNMGVSESFILSYPEDVLFDRELIENNIVDFQEAPVDLVETKKIDLRNLNLFRRKQEQEIIMGSVTNIDNNSSQKPKLLFKNLNKIKSDLDKESKSQNNFESVNYDYKSDFLDFTGNSFNRFFEK